MNKTDNTLYSKKLLTPAVVFALTSQAMLASTGVQAKNNYNSQIPHVVVEEMEIRELNPEELSFIVTPLPNTESNTDGMNNGKLPLTNVKELLLERYTNQLEKHITKNAEKESQLRADTTVNTTGEVNETTQAQKNAQHITHVSPKVALRLARLQGYIDGLEQDSSAQPLRSGYQHLAHKQRTPASTMKLIPTFVGLATLGKDFVWTTRVFYDGYRAGDTLYGDLIIKGSGDPQFTHHKLERLLYQVKALGITHIEGDIIIDSSIFRNVTKDPAAFDNEPLRPYNASPDGFLVNFSTVTIDSYPINNAKSTSAQASSNKVGSNKASSKKTNKHKNKSKLSGKSKLIYTPNLADITLPPYVNHRSSVCSSAKYSLAPVWQKDKLVFNKAMPNRCGRRSFPLAYPNAKTFAQQVTKAKWLAMGNTLTGVVKDSSAMKKTTNSQVSWYQQLSIFAIVREYSYPLSEQIYDINHYSNNVMTEQVLLSIPVYENGANSIAINSASTYPKAINSVYNWWSTNLTSQPPYMTNGSGLCRICTVSVNALNEMLVKAYQHKEFSSYVNSLGVAGVSGTIYSHKKRRPESAAIGRAWIKTGTLNNVTAMAGYVKGKSGQEYSVVAMVNLPKGRKWANSKRPVLDSLIEWVAEH